VITLRKVTLFLIALVLLGAQSGVASNPPAPGKSHGAAAKGFADGNRGHQGRGMSDGN
jgi:hypothetical protein